MAMVLGIDPGSRYFGFGLVQAEDSTNISYIDSGVIALSDKLSFPEKLATLSEKLQGVFDQHSVSKVAVENIFLGKNVQSAFKLGHVRGITLLLAQRNGCLVSEYAPKFVKKVLTGSGSSGKEAVQMMVNQLLKVNVTQVDESDALSLALCQILSAPVRPELAHFRI